MVLAEAFRLGIDPLAWTILPRINIGPLAISPHGIGIAVGFLLGAQLMVRRARRFGGPDENDIWNCLFWALLGSMVGARVGYVLGHFSQVTDGETTCSASSRCGRAASRCSAGSRARRSRTR